MLKTAFGWGGLVLAILALAVSVLSQAPEDPARTSADGFSLPRAKASLATIAAAPRPRGSAAHGKVRDYLVEELKSLGLEVSLQEGTFDDSLQISKRASGEDRGVAEHTRLTNVIARIPGEDPSGMLLLMAHYDSVRGSPGAGDDGAGVVAVLEAMRVLSKTQPRNDVLALISDGEEEGLRGARLFADEHPLFDSVDVVLNFEAIGNGGPALMFETGPDSGGLIDLWARSSPQPRGNSLAPVIYGWLPNDTDFSIFRDANVRGLNFAIAGGSGAYHTPGDTPERFEDRSLAHMSRTAIALGTRLANRDLLMLDGGTRSFDSQPLLGRYTWSDRRHLVLPSVLILAWALWCIARAGVSAFGFARGALSAGLIGGAAGLATLAGGTAWRALAQPSLPVSYDGIHLMLVPMIGAAFLGVLLVARLYSQRDEQRLRELYVAAPIYWIAAFGFFAAIDLGQLGAAYPFAWAAGCGCVASYLRLRGHSSLSPGLVLVPALFEVGPILAQLLQLSSQDLDVTVRMGGVLVGLGSVLLLPILPHKRGVGIERRRAEA